jgi:hypothetical protein
MGGLEFVLLDKNPDRPKSSLQPHNAYFVLEFLPAHGIQLIGIAGPLSRAVFDNSFQRFGDHPAEPASFISIFAGGGHNWKFLILDHQPGHGGIWLVFFVFVLAWHTYEADSSISFGQ